MMPDRPITRRDALRITAVAGVSAAFGTPLALSIVRDAALHRVSETRTRMGTVVTLTIVHPEEGAAHAMIGAAFAEMDRLEGILSRHRAETPITALNTRGHVDAPPPELVTVLTEARHVSVATGGAFDVTIAPLLGLYESSFRARGAPPTDAEIDRARDLVDFRGVDISHDRIALARPRMSITLDGIAKGFIVDRTTDVLLQHGADRVLVNAGGDMSALDLSGDQPWTVGIQNPDDERRTVSLVRLEGRSIATSGDYMRSFTNDRTHHHIIDPRSGRSPVELASVSVIEGRAILADAWSTALLVLGPDEGMAVLGRAPGPEALFVGKNGMIKETPGFGERAV
jgi:FAD:protein FMN transferase